MGLSITDNYLVNLERISTPKESLLMFQTGPIDVQRLAEARSRRFDHAPVTDGADQLLGVISVAHVEQLHHAGLPIEPADPELYLHEFADRISLLPFLEEIAERRAVVIRDTDGQHDPDWFALVTISDLNRHAFRSHLYPLVAELETVLADLIDRTYDDPWSWITWTGESAQIGHIGRWELEKRKGVDTSPITGCTLTDLINVIAKSDDLRPALGFGNRKKFQEFSGPFALLRNQIMHPVRPLILEANDVNELYRRVLNLLELTSRVTALIDERSQDSPEPLRFMP
jgi:hypothetical protein